MRSLAEVIRNIYNSLAALSNGKLDTKGGTIKGDLVIEGSLTASNFSEGSSSGDNSGDVAGEESFSAVKIRKLLDVTKWDKDTHRQVVEDDKIKADSTILMSLPVGTADDVYSSFGAANIIARAQNDGSVTLEYTGTEPDQSYLVSMCIL